MSSDTATYDSNFITKKNVFTKTGYLFNGWNEKADGTGTAWNLSSAGVYESGKSWTWKYTNNITLYAQWKPITYTVKYNGNGATSGSTASSSHTYDQAKNLTANGFTKTGYHFVGWATSPNGSVVYSNQQSVKNLTATNGVTVNLYAKWAANTYTIKLDSNGGTGTMADISATYDKDVTLPKSTFRKDEYTFIGWSTTKDGDVKYKDGATVKNLTSTNNGTATLYAKWKELPKSHGTSIAILKQDGLKMIENNTLESFIRNEIAFHIDNNPDNITLKDYKITNLTTVQTTIKNTTNKQELELKFEITYSTGDKSYKTAEPITITIVNVVLGDENTSYTRYIDENETLKNNSKWNSGTSKNLLNEALKKKIKDVNGYEVTK